MTIFRTALLVVCAAYLASCADSFPGVGVLAPESPAGYEMDASGMKGSYFYKFASDGTYRRETILPSGEKSPPQSGTWKWERQSPNNATLVLDDKLAVTLAFTTRDHANAALVDDERLYPVEFTAPE